MNNTLAIISEVIILIFNILIFMQLIVLKRDTIATRVGMRIGSAIILLAFFVGTYFLKLPEVFASFLFVTIPTVTLFWILSKYKDARFFVIFCLVDTFTLILTFFARAVEVWFGTTAGIVAYVLVVMVMGVVYIKGTPLFKGFRELLINVNDGWLSMAFATALIYVLLIFSASYPKPLAERTEYLVVYSVLSLTILAFYAVFIQTLLHKKNLNDLNMQLTKEKQWHKIAYEDALTGLKNRMAYMEYSNDIERIAEKTDHVYTLMLDIDKFKQINDTHGHYVGDNTLKGAAALLRKVFDTSDYQLFRIGGDEFAVIALNVSKEALEGRIAVLREKDNEDESLSFSLGYASADFSENNAMEKALIRADRMMYKEKELKKASVQD